MSKNLKLYALAALAVFAVSVPNAWAGGNKVLKNNPNPVFVVPDVCTFGATSVVQHTGLLLTSNPGNAGFDVFPSDPSNSNAVSLFDNTIPFTPGTFSYLQTIVQNPGYTTPILPSLVLGYYQSAPAVPVSLLAGTTTDPTNTRISINTTPPAGSSGQLLGLQVFYHDDFLSPLVISVNHFSTSFTIRNSQPFPIMVGVDAVHSLICGAP